MKKNWIKLKSNLDRSSITAVHRTHEGFSKLLRIDIPEWIIVPRQKTKMIRLDDLDFFVQLTSDAYTSIETTSGRMIIVIITDNMLKNTIFSTTYISSKMMLFNWIESMTSSQRITNQI
jgi:hypothetical protein